MKKDLDKKIMTDFFSPAENTPDKFKKALDKAKSKIDQLSPQELELAFFQLMVASGQNSEIKSLVDGIPEESSQSLPRGSR